MARLTKTEKVTQFYYNLNRLNQCMQQYQDYLKSTSLCESHKKAAEKNEMGRIAEEKNKAIKLWSEQVEKNKEKVKESLNEAVVAYDKLKELLK